jgi:hypothetical protein
MYPNPATNEVFVLNETDLSLILEVRDIVGKIIIQKSIASGETALDLTSFESGTYFFNLFDGNGLLVKSEKLVKVGK